MHNEYEIDIENIIINFTEIFKLSDNQQNIIIELIKSSFTNITLNFKDVLIIKSLIESKYLITRREKNLDSLI